MPILSHAVSIFTVTYFAAYFLRAWLFPNVPAEFRSSRNFVDPKVLLIGGWSFRAILATAMMAAYALW